METITSMIRHLLTYALHLPLLLYPYTLLQLLQVSCHFLDKSCSFLPAFYIRSSQPRMSSSSAIISQRNSVLQDLAPMLLTLLRLALQPKNCLFQAGVAHYNFLSCSRCHSPVLWFTYLPISFSSPH